MDSIHSLQQCVVHLCFRYPWGHHMCIVYIKVVDLAKSHVSAYHVKLILYRVDGEVDVVITRDMTIVHDIR